jgi:hypothetical protein
MRSPWREAGCHGTELKEGKMAETSSSEEVSTKLQQVAELAKKAPGMTVSAAAGDAVARTARAAVAAAAEIEVKRGIKELLERRLRSGRGGNIAVARIWRSLIVGGAVSRSGFARRMCAPARARIPARCRMVP